LERPDRKQCCLPPSGRRAFLDQETVRIFEVLFGAEGAGTMIAMALNVRELEGEAAISEIFRVL